MAYAARLVRTGGAYDLRDSKSPETPRQWFLLVPEKVGVLVGKREDRFGLGTREPAEAKRRHLSNPLKSNNGGPTCGAAPKNGLGRGWQLGGTVAAQWSPAMAVNPHQSLFWNTIVGALLWKDPPESAGDYHTDALEPLDPKLRGQNELESWCKQVAESFLIDSGSDSSSDNVLILARAISISMQRVANEHRTYLATTFFSEAFNVLCQKFTRPSFRLIRSGLRMKYLSALSSSTAAHISGISVSLVGTDLPDEELWGAHHGILWVGWLRCQQRI